MDRPTLVRLWLGGVQVGLGLGLLLGLSRGWSYGWAAPGILLIGLGIFTTFTYRIPRDYDTKFTRDL